MNIKNIFFTFAIMLFAVTAARSNDDPQAAVARRRQIEHLRQKAVSAFQAGDHDQAILCYKQWSEISPRDPLVLKDLMWALYQQRRFAEIDDIVRRVIDLRPQDREAIDMMARCPSPANLKLIVSLYERSGQKLNQGKKLEKASAIVSVYQMLRALLPNNNDVTDHLFSGLKDLSDYQQGTQLAGYLLKKQPLSSALWKDLADMEGSLEHWDIAINAYRKSLRLNPDQPVMRLTIGKMLIKKRDFEGALDVLKPIRSGDASLAEVYPLLATAQFWTMRYADSLPNWAKAVSLFPDNITYQRYEAQTLFYCGRRAEARQKFLFLADAKGDVRSMDFLADEEIARGGVLAAEQFLEKRLQLIRPCDEGLALRLATLYQSNNQEVKMIAVLDRLLATLPDNLLALKMKADYFYSLNRYEEALGLFLNMHGFNPHNLRAMEGIVACWIKLDDSASALPVIDALLAADPVNPLYLRNKAELLFKNVERKQAKQLLARWAEENRDANVLTILLYHGLTSFANDSILAYGFHTSNPTFEDHIRALKNAGYTPIVASQVADQIEKDIPLPHNPVMITFDDGRLDSFMNADPIMEKYNFRATMFAAIVNIEGLKPGYASWDRMRAYQKTNRWEIQSHGDLSSNFIPSGPDGRNGLFLITHQWLEKESRFETPEEYEQRITQDFKRSKQQISEHTGKEPSAFAFPAGYYGQDGNANSPDVTLSNISGTKKYYRTVYIQDYYGLNIINNDSYLLKRFIPKNYWTGNDLVDHLKTNNPVNQVYAHLIQFAISDKRYREARYWLEKMKWNEATKETLRLEEAKIYFNAGNPSRAKKLAWEAATLKNQQEVDKICENYEKYNRPQFKTQCEYKQDNSDNRAWVIDNTLDITSRSPLQLSLRQKHGDFRQNGGGGVETVIDNAAGIAFGAPLGLFNHISAEVLGHGISGPSRHDVTALGTIRSSLTDNVNARVEIGRSLPGTAKALNANITNVYENLLLRWRGDSPWELGARQIYRLFSDDNNRHTVSCEVSRPIELAKGLKGLYRYTYDNSQRQSPEYYCPQSLVTNGVGFEYSYVNIDPLNEIRVELEFNYMLAYARERGERYEFDHSVETMLTLNVSDRFTIIPSYTYSMTPFYSEHRAAVRLTARL